MQVKCTVHINYEECREGQSLVKKLNDDSKVTSPRHCSVQDNCLDLN